MIILCFEITLNCLQPCRMDLIIHVSFTLLNKTNFKKESEARGLEGLIFAITHSKPRQAPCCKEVKESLLSSVFSLGSRKSGQVCAMRSLIGFFPYGKDFMMN